MRNYYYYTSLVRILQMRRSGSILRLSGGEKQRIAFAAIHLGRAACVNPVESLKFPPAFWRKSQLYVLCSCVIIQIRVILFNLRRHGFPLKAPPPQPNCRRSLL